MGKGGAIGFLARERTVAGPGFNRWLIPPAALLAHLSIGEIYAFSVFKNPLVERFRTGLTPIAIIFSISIVLWALVLIPLLWGIYQTLTDVVALFA